MTRFSIGRPPAIVHLNAQQVQNDPGGYLGPWLMALVGITFMMGILATQSTKYFSAFGYEGPRMFTLVVSCILLSIAQWVIIIQASWDWLVHHYGDWDRFASIPWQSSALQVVSRLTAFTSQLFFAYRCYLLYNRSKLVLGGLLLGMSTTLALFGVIGGALATEPFKSCLPKRLIIPALTINLATDISITGLTLWKLGGRGEQSSNPNTENALRRLRNVTVEAAVPPAICAILNMITYFTLKNLTHNWFVMMTARFYVWSFMYTLNSRVAIRRHLNAPNHDGQDLSTGFEFANQRGSGLERREGDAGKSTVAIATIPEAIHPARASLASVDRRTASRSV